MVRFMKKQNQKTNNGSRQITVVAGNSFASFFFKVRTYKLHRGHLQVWHFSLSLSSFDNSRPSVCLFNYAAIVREVITSHAKHLVLFYIVAFARGSSKVRSTRHSTSCTIALASYS